MPQGKRGQPSHHLYQIVGEGQDSVWNTVGAAWSSEDGKSFEVRLDAAPLHGRLLMCLLVGKTR